VAHEINNPLEAVTNLLFLARTDPQLATETREYLERADQELARLGSIARRTLTFVRPKTSKGPSDVNEVVESVVAMFQPRCSARGAEIRVLQKERPILPVPADDLRQILTNIVSNACDALPASGGVIEVEVAREANVAAISIRDNGSGISPENLSRVFDPFFTTKEDTGTGIGLWVTRDLVDKNGGRIQLVTDQLPPGFRTQFRVEFAVS
jgi:signal transduction histidine kinase